MSSDIEIFHDYSLVKRVLNLKEVNLEESEGHFYICDLVLLSMHNPLAVLNDFYEALKRYASTLDRKVIFTVARELDGPHGKSVRVSWRSE